jgi:hypothetical protein
MRVEAFSWGEGEKWSGGCWDQIDGAAAAAAGRLDEWGGAFKGRRLWMIVSDTYLGTFSNSKLP